MSRSDPGGLPVGPPVALEILSARPSWKAARSRVCGVIRTSADDVSSAFLTSALRNDFPRADVTWCRPEPLTSERGMSRTIVRLHLGGEAGLPASLIGKLTPADPAGRAQLHAMGFFEREVRFYRALAAATPMDTPTCYFADLDPGTGHAFPLLEDLAPARIGDTVAGATLEDVTVALLALAGCTRGWWQDATVGDQPWLRLPSMLAPSAVAEVFERSWPLFLSRLSTRATTGPRPFSLITRSGDL